MLGWLVGELVYAQLCWPYPSNLKKLQFEACMLWCAMLSCRYELALQQLQEDQRHIDRRVARGGFRSKDRDMALQVRLLNLL